MKKLAAAAAVVALLASGGGSALAARPSPPANVSPPTVSGVAQVGATLQASTGTWTGSNPMRFSYEWLRCDDSGSGCVGVTGATSSSYTLTSADASMTVRVAVTATNKRGQASAISAAIGPVAAGPARSSGDTTAPTAPSALSVSNVTQTSLTLSWAAASDDVAVAGYRVYRDGALVATTTSRSFENSPLSCGTSYNLAVEAFDAAGNTSPRAATTGATAACSGGGGQAASGLRVQGNKIVDGAGNPVVLHGVNRSGTEYACQDNWGFSDGSIEDAALQKIADWKTSSVRVLLNERCWNVDLADNSWDGAAYRTEMVAYVNRLVGKGLVPIVSLMWSAPGSNKAYNAPMPNRDNSPRFWTSVANTFKGNGNVIFDLLNEPYPDGNGNTAEAWRCWKNGGTCAGLSFQAAGMQELVDGIRATGATNVISIPGVQYANNLTGWLANKPFDPLGNLVASWHVYEFNRCNNVTCYENEVAPVLAQVPVIANEIGAECNSGTGWASTLIKWLDSKSTGYNAWTWNAWGDCSHSLITNYDTGNPTWWGTWYRDHLQSLASPTPAVSSGPALLFSDDFNTLDRSRWVTKFWWGGDAHVRNEQNELQAFRDHNVTVSNGLLYLTARKESTYDYLGRPVSYTSGMISSGGTNNDIQDEGYTFTYGRAEAKIKMPPGTGFWVGFWLCDLPECKRELDVVEWLGKEPYYAYTSFHGHDLGIHITRKCVWSAPLSNEFHVYAMEWRPTFISYSVDGVECMRYTGDGIPSDPHFMMVTFTVGGIWPGNPDDTTPFPSSALVDWIRVYS